MADLSQIKIANTTYNIKDAFAREKITALESAGSGGGNGKTKYLHVFEYTYSGPPPYNVIVYVPSDSSELLGTGILTKMADDVAVFKNQIFVPGMFAVISMDDMGTDEPPHIVPLKFKYYEDSTGTYPFGTNYLGVEIMGEIREFGGSDMTFISEKVI